MTKFRAFLIHFGLSFIIFLALAYLLWFVWFPDFFFVTDGGWQGMRIIIGVDLVLGPLLTLIVFKKGKPGLLFDLTVIGLVQCLCLVYGTWLIYTQRPIAMVYVDGHFFSMNANAYKDANTPIPDLDTFPGKYPKWVQVELPEDKVESGIIQSDTFRAGTPMRAATAYYKPFNADAVFLTQSRDIREIKHRDAETQYLPGWLEKHQGQSDDFLFYPFGARYEYLYIGFDKTGKKIDILPVEGPI